MLPGVAENKARDNCQVPFKRIQTWVRKRAARDSRLKHSLPPTTNADLYKSELSESFT